MCFLLIHSIMFNRIISFSIHNKFIVGMMTLGIVVYGLYSFKQLPIDAVPDITNNQVQIFTLTPTLATQEVEQLVSAPIERSLASLPDVEEIRSISRFGLSVVTIVFKEKVDIYFARQLVRERIDEAKQNIPEGVGTPELSPVSTGLGEVYQYLVEADSAHRGQFDAMKLREIQDWIVARQILGTPGVAEVNSFGGLSKQYEVSIDPVRLQSKSLTISDVFSALQNNNENTGGGYIDKKPNAYFIRGLGLIKSLDDVSNIFVKNIGGVPVYIRDVAQVQFGSGTRYGAMTADGNGEVVGGIARHFAAVQVEAGADLRVAAAEILPLLAQPGQFALVVVEDFVVGSVHQAASALPSGARYSPVASVKLMRRTVCATRMLAAMANSALLLARLVPFSISLRHTEAA